MSCSIDTSRSAFNRPRAVQLPDQVPAQWAVQFAEDLIRKIAEVLRRRGAAAVALAHASL